MFKLNYSLLRAWISQYGFLLTSVILVMAIFGCGGGSSGTGSYSSTSTKRVFGTLSDPTGNAISGVTVTDSQSGVSTSTDQNGAFDLETETLENEIELEIESMGTSVDIRIDEVPEEAIAVELAVEFDAIQELAQVTSVEFSDELPPAKDDKEDSVIPEDLEISPPPICIDDCGDGICAEEVCFSDGCSCQETANTCPQDCPLLQECLPLCGDGQCTEEPSCSDVDGVCACAENIIECPEDCDPDVPEVPVCVDYCGDGICAEIVCLAHGCPCAESPSSCPQDCETPSTCLSSCGDGQCSAEESCSDLDGQSICTCAESSVDCPVDCSQPVEELGSAEVSMRNMAAAKGKTTAFSPF